jgi:propionate CoA-transferase
MDARIFRDEAMGMREDMLALPLEQRFAYDEKHNMFFVNFEGLNVRSAADIERIRQLIEARLTPLDRNVYAIVNYDNFTLNPELLDTYMDMVRDLVGRFYIRVTRYTTSTFTRARLGDALAQRDVTPHFFNTSAEALARLQQTAE